MKTFDLTSDIHIDFWVDATNNAQKQKKNFRTLINKLLPSNPSDTLVIAGDLGHYNHQNKLFLITLREFYKNIILVHGNHDLYMISASIRKSFLYNSFNRLDNMISICNKIPGVHYLVGNVIDVDGIRFGGTGMWYDDFYAMNSHYMSSDGIQIMWEMSMNDANLIYQPYDTGKPNGFDRHAFVAEQKILMDKVIATGCDVVVSHVSPTSDFFSSHYQIPSSTFYQFDGSKYLNELDDTKIWCYGHTHEVKHNIHKNGCRVMCNPLGYPKDTIGYNWITSDFPEERKFVTIDIKPLISLDELFSGTENA